MKSCRPMRFDDVIEMLIALFKQIIKKDKKVMEKLCEYCGSEAELKIICKSCRKFFEQVKSATGEDLHKTAERTLSHYNDPVPDERTFNNSTFF